MQRRKPHTLEPGTDGQTLQTKGGRAQWDLPPEQLLYDAKGDILIGSANDARARLAVGANGQVLTADSTQALGVKWVSPVGDALLALMDAKGDLLVAAGDNAAARLGVGADGQVLTADSSLALGVKWAAATGGGSGGGGAIGARYPVNESSGGGGVNTSARSIGITTPTVGNYLVACLASEGAQNVTAVSGGGVTWAKLAESTPSVAPHIEIWGGVVGASPNGTVNVNWNSGAYCGLSVSEWAGLTGTVHASAIAPAGSRMYVPKVTPTNPAALVITAASQSTWAGGYTSFDSPSLLWFNSTTLNLASAFGFPGTNAALGAWGNSHGGSFAGATIALL